MKDYDEDTFREKKESLRRKKTIFRRRKKKLQLAFHIHALNA
jgi:hypothetical protein